MHHRHRLLVLCVQLGSAQPRRSPHAHQRGAWLRRRRSQARQQASRGGAGGRSTGGGPPGGG
eukprot:scaffold11221_cov51-Isochrysis_galbana.AAC.1